MSTYYLSDFLRVIAVVSTLFVSCDFGI